MEDKKHLPIYPKSDMAKFNSEEDRRDKEEEFVGGIETGNDDRITATTFRYNDEKSVCLYLDSRSIRTKWEWKIMYEIAELNAEQLDKFIEVLTKAKKMIE